MDTSVRERLQEWAQTYNDPKYFQQDPIAFPTEFLRRGASLRDIEIAAVFAAHFAWGRRAMIVRDCERFFDFIEWQPERYVMNGDYRSDSTSIHRTVKWEDTAAICANLRSIYTDRPTLEGLSAAEIRTQVYGQSADPKAPNKKINMMRRWMVRRDGKVDLGLWTETDPKDLLVPLDIHVYDEATALGLTSRRQKDIRTAEEITGAFSEIWPEDPLLGDFALFGYGVTNNA